MGIRSGQVNDGTLQRRDMDTTTPGQSVITQLAVTGAGKPAMTQTGADAGTGQVTLDFPAPAGGGAADWPGVLHAAFGDCDPVDYAAMMRAGLSQNAPTPTQLTAAAARCVKFRPPAAMGVGRVYLYGVGATTGLYKFAIYRASDNAKVWDSGAVNSAANTWLPITVNPSVQLAADADYWFCVTATATGTTAGFASPAPPVNAALFGAAAAPLGNTSVGLGVYAQFAVTGGAFPAALPALAAAAYSGTAGNGSVPFAFLTP